MSHILLAKNFNEKKIVAFSGVITQDFVLLDLPVLDQIKNFAIESILKRNSFDKSLRVD